MFRWSIPLLVAVTSILTLPALGWAQRPPAGPVGPQQGSYIIGSGQDHYHNYPTYGSNYNYFRYYTYPPNTYGFYPFRNPSSGTTFSYTAVPSDTTAHVTVDLPQDAELWFDKTKINGTGATRVFQTPPLTPGPRYTYQVRARWEEGGREIAQSQEIEVAPGASTTVKFPVPPKAKKSGTQRPKP